MAKPNSQERRKQVLKQRRAEEQREADREEAQYLYKEAVFANRAGDAPAAGRYLKKALILNPNHAGALELLAEIHDRAGHYAEALGYLRRAREFQNDPEVLYRIAVMFLKMDQGEQATGAMREFLAASKPVSEPRIQKLRVSAEAFLKIPLPPPPPPKSAPPAAERTEAKQIGRASCRERV